jgi:hypothetical protein
MKALILSSLMFSSMSFAQDLDVKTFKNLLSQRQATLEKVNQGMSKKLIILTKIPTEIGFCELKETAVQTVLKIEGDKIIVHSKENYVPAATPSCAGFEASEVSVLFYEDKPALASDLADLDASAADIRSIVKAGEIVSMNLSSVVTEDDGTSRNEAVSVKYDLTKPSFKNLIFTQDSTSSTTGEDMADIDVYSINLKKILFCDSNDSESCVEGDFSDILF